MMIWAKRQEAAGSETLDRSEDDELEQAARHAAQEGPEQKNENRCAEHGLAPILVAELAVDRHHACGAQNIGGDHPGEISDAAEVVDDARQRRCDDTLVDRA
jgi:hypothetical protein